MDFPIPRESSPDEDLSDWDEIRDKETIVNFLEDYNSSYCQQEAFITLESQAQPDNPVVRFVT